MPFGVDHPGAGTADAPGHFGALPRRYHFSLRGSRRHRSVHQGQRRIQVFPDKPSPLLNELLQLDNLGIQALSFGNMPAFIVANPGLADLGGVLIDNPSVRHDLVQNGFQLRPRAPQQRLVLRLVLP